MHNELKLSKKCNLIFGFGWMYYYIPQRLKQTFLHFSELNWPLFLGATPLEKFQKNFCYILFMLNSLSQNCTFFHVLSHCVVQATINEWPRTLSLWKKIEQKIDLINLRVILKI